jgi:hypothetical protein
LCAVLLELRNPACEGKMIRIILSIGIHKIAWKRKINDLSRSLWHIFHALDYTVLLPTQPTAIKHF